MMNIDSILIVGTPAAINIDAIPYDPELSYPPDAIPFLRKFGVGEFFYRLRIPSVAHHDTYGDQFLEFLHLDGERILYRIEDGMYLVSSSIEAAFDGQVRVIGSTMPDVLAMLFNEFFGDLAGIPDFPPFFVPNHVSTWTHGFESDEWHRVVKLLRKMNLSRLSISNSGFGFYSESGLTAAAAFRDEGHGWGIRLSGDDNEVRGISSLIFSGLE